MLSRVAAVFALRGDNILSLQTLRSTGGAQPMTVELSDADAGALIADLTALEDVERATLELSLGTVYGKRVIIIGGRAQVGQVRSGRSARRIGTTSRGERISVDTIPLVGEAALADAVQAVARLPRAQVLVLAGALMGNAITEAVRDIQRQEGLTVASPSTWSARRAMPPTWRW
ncbi:MAG: DUF5612 domain-containing protein [Vicinamibacterales bacterium]